MKKISESERLALRDYMADNAHSTTSLGKQLGISQTTIAAWIRKDGASARESHWAKIAPVIKPYLEQFNLSDSEQTLVMFFRSADKKRKRKIMSTAMGLEG